MVDCGSFPRTHLLTTVGTADVNINTELINIPDIDSTLLILPEH